MAGHKVSSISILNNLFTVFFSWLSWMLFAVKAGQIGCDRFDLFVVHALGSDAHEAADVIAALAVGKISQLLRHVGHVLTSDARVDQVASALRLVATNAGWHTGFFIALKVHHFAKRRRLLISVCVGFDRLAAVVGGQRRD